MYTLSYSKDTLREFNEMIKECDEKIKELENELEKAKKYDKRQCIYDFCNITNKVNTDNIIGESIKNIQSEVEKLKIEREALQVGLDRFSKEYKNEIQKEVMLEKEIYDKKIRRIYKNVYA